MARRAAPDEFSVTLTGVDLDADGLKLLVWLTAENSYWNNVLLWLAAERAYQGAQIVDLLREVQETGDYSLINSRMADVYRVA